MINENINKLAQIIKEQFHPKKIILFGSYAYGNPQKGSDVDFLVVMETILSPKEQAFLIRRELDSNVPVDILVRTPQELEERIKLGDFFLRKVLRDGITL